MFVSIGFSTPEERDEWVEVCVITLTVADIATVVTKIDLWGARDLTLTTLTFNENVTPKYHLVLSQIVRDYSVLFTRKQYERLSCNWMGTNGLKVKIENE